MIIHILLMVDFTTNVPFYLNCSKELLYEIATATGKETRARNNYYVSKGITADHTGITCFSPLINIMRHPLWGRNQVGTICNSPLVVDIDTERYQPYQAPSLGRKPGRYNMQQPSGSRY